MSEDLPVPVSPEITTSPSFREVMLHNQAIQLPQGQVLHDLDASRALGFNGTTLAEIVLPTPIEPGSTEDKRLALIDFGGIPPEGKAMLYFPDTGTEVRTAGITQSRYALMSVNYTPPGAMAGFTFLSPGSSKTIGKSDSPDNQRLGLFPTDEYLAGSHATITIAETGDITISDDSVNGTRVILPVSQ